MSRSGISLDTPSDCYQAVKQWADADNDATSFKQASKTLREKLDKAAAALAVIANNSPNNDCKIFALDAFKAAKGISP